MSAVVTPSAIEIARFADLEAELPSNAGRRFRGLNPALQSVPEARDLAWLAVLLAPTRDPWLWWVAVMHGGGGECTTSEKPYLADDVAAALVRMGAEDCSLTAEKPLRASSMDVNPFVVQSRPVGPKRFGARSVYFIQPVDGGLIKIGVSSHPAGRLDALQTGCPVDLRIVGLIPDAAPGTEPELHARFANARVRGEWFEPTPELLAFIAERAS